MTSGLSLLAAWQLCGSGVCFDPWVMVKVSACAGEGGGGDAPRVSELRQGDAWQGHVYQLMVEAIYMFDGPDNMCADGPVSAHRADMGSLGDVCVASTDRGTISRSHPHDLRFCPPA